MNKIMIIHGDTLHTPDEISIPDNVDELKYLINREEQSPHKTYSKIITRRVWGHKGTWRNRTICFIDEELVIGRIGTKGWKDGWQTYVNNSYYIIDKR